MFDLRVAAQPGPEGPSGVRTFLEHEDIVGSGPQQSPRVSAAEVGSTRQHRDDRARPPVCPGLERCEQGLVGPMAEQNARAGPGFLAGRLHEVDPACAEVVTEVGADRTVPGAHVACPRVNGVHGGKDPSRLSFSQVPARPIPGRPRRMAGTCRFAGRGAPGEWRPDRSGVRRSCGIDPLVVRLSRARRRG